MVNAFYLFLGLKVLRLVLSYVAIVIAKNLTSQIYMDKVLVNQENPPSLNNLLYLYLGIEAGFFVLLMIMLYMVGTIDTFKLQDTINTELFTNYLLPDYIIYLILTVVLGLVLSSKMYSKKYFLYKDDGLRGIRALSEILFTYSVINSIVPYNFLVTGIMSEMKKN
jgi:hypothetical protein